MAKNRVKQMGPRPKIEHPGKTFARVMKYVLKDYGVHYFVVVLCILVTVYASLQGTMFMRTLIDQYIKPLLGGKIPISRRLPARSCGLGHSMPQA